MRLQKVCDYGNNRTLIYRGKCIVTNIVCDYRNNLEQTMHSSVAGSHPNSDKKNHLDVAVQIQNLVAPLGLRKCTAQQINERSSSCGRIKRD